MHEQQANVDAYWHEMKPSSINPCWRKIQPQVVEKNTVPPVQDEEDEIVRLAHQDGCEGFDDKRQGEINGIAEFPRKSVFG